MFQLLWAQSAADINLKNRQGYTPLSLSAKLSRGEVEKFNMRVKFFKIKI